MAGSIGSVARKGVMLEGSYVMASWSNDWIDLHAFKVNEEFRALPLAEIAKRIEAALRAKNWFKYSDERFGGIHDYDPVSGVGNIAVNRIYMIGD